ncbi:MAG: sensor histidine kinase, partial [Myxococcales bacterium]
MFIDGALVTVDGSREHLVERDGAAGQRGLEDGQGGSQIAQPFVADDLTLAEDLARRAAVAVDNARLFNDAREAVHARDEFLSIASHELRTPLTALQLHLQGLLRKLAAAEDAPPWVEGKLRTAQRQTERLSGLVDSLLDVARISTGRMKLQPEAFHLVEAVNEVQSRFAEQLARAGCELKVQVEGDAAGHWDRLRIEQVITNLLSNAVKYAPGKPIEVTVGGSGDWVTVTVTDHGMGIPSDAVPRIFDRFERAVSSRSYGGLGLGLYISRQIVEAHGGSIDVRTGEGEGTTFVVRLPREA